MTPTHGWSERGKKCIFLPKQPIKPVAWQVVVGSFNKQRFISFLQDKLLTADGGGGGSHILMDNVQFHHSREVKSLLEQHQTNPIYNPPYHPDSNPIEMVFSILKAQARKIRPNNQQELEDMIGQTIASPRLSGSVLASLFRHALAT